MSISGNIPNALSVPLWSSCERRPRAMEREYTLGVGASSPAHLKGRLLNNRGVALRLGSWGVRVECRTARDCRSWRRRLLVCPSRRCRIRRDGARGDPGTRWCDQWSTRRGRRWRRVTRSHFACCSMKSGHVRRMRLHVRTGQGDAYSSNDADTRGRSDCRDDVTPEVTAPTCLVVTEPIVVGHGLRGRYTNEIRRKRHLRTSGRQLLPRYGVTCRESSWIRQPRRIAEITPLRRKR
jgi:hypothetical protein